ncbi:MAG: hypothetical protein WA947_08845 [Phormidesmis sp.]
MKSRHIIESIIIKGFKDFCLLSQHSFLGCTQSIENPTNPAFRARSGPLLSHIESLIK